MASDEPKYETIDPHNLSVHPELTPPDDFVLSYLFGRALDGFLPVYETAIPVALVSPFAPEFRPQHAAFRALVETFVRDTRAKRYPAMWVYQREDRFVMSDDYAKYYAYLEAGVDFAGCLILGDFDCDQVSHREGPLSTQAVKQAMFGPHR